MVLWSCPVGIFAVPQRSAARPVTALGAHDECRSSGASGRFDDPARRGRNRVEDVGDDWRSLLLGAPPSD
ncbi:MAG: hypothetical protein GEV08_22885 [Acidimicrobiia bacterium]|nr:hypothetical protein [Acidimicrobiia bacterium]